MKRIVVTVVKGIAGTAAVVFIFCPLSTGTQILAFVGSIVVFLICHTVLNRHATSEKRTDDREC